MANQKVVVVSRSSLHRAESTVIRPRMHRPRSRSRAALFTFAFFAASAFVMVNVIDPYSGATASPYYQVPTYQTDAQMMTVAGEYSNEIQRDGYTSEAAPEPEPEPEPVVTASSDHSGGAPAAGNPDPGSAQAYAQSALQARGMGGDQFSCLVALWNRESGWNMYAYNASSGAYGIPQSLPGDKMASAGADWRDNAATQVEWGLGYIMNRYGSPCGAWAHSEDAGWY